jgi:hypothetical protein
MKKYLPLILILFLAVISDGYTQERVDAVESIVPSRVMLYLKTSRVRQAVVSLKFAVDNLLTRADAEKFNQKVSGIKNKIGVDPMDLESLKTAGIDVDRTASLAIYAKGKRDEERVLLFVPVLDDRTFPLKFVEILKRVSGNVSADVYPAITEYNGHTLYQIGRDIFATAFDGVFILGSTGELVRSVIDVKMNNSGYLALDPMYSDYLAKTRKNYDLRAFATRDFLKDILKKDVKKEGEPRKEGKKGDSDNALNQAELTNVQYLADAAANQPSVRSELEKLSTGPSPFNAIDYAFLGGSVKPTEIDIDIAARFNTSSGTVNTVLEIMKTGVAGRALYVKNTATYAYLSIDFNKVEELCKNSMAGCSYYNGIKDQVKEEMGIDFGKDIVPYFGGVMNIIAGQPKGAGGGYLLFLPMDDTAQGKKAWDKSSAYLAAKFKGTERYGTGKVGGAKSFWYVDSKNTKIHVVCDRRGLYLGNDQELMAEALAAKGIGEKGVKDDVVSKLGGNVFFLTHIKKESYFGTLLTLLSYRVREISGIIDRMTDLYVIGEKIDSFVSVNIKLKLMKRT